MMDNTNMNTGFLIPSSSSSSSSTALIDEVRMKLIRNSTRTLTSEAQALLQQTYSKEWEQQESSIFNNTGSFEESQSFSKASTALLPAIPPITNEAIELEFGENTLDWVSGLYNKLPNHEAASTSTLNNNNSNEYLHFGGLRRFSISDDEVAVVADNDNVIQLKTTIMSCSQCGFVATNRKQLWRHGKRMNHITRGTTKIEIKKHGSKECHEHQCDLCLYTSKSRFNVLRHFQRVHVNQKSTSCDLCDKQFKDSDTLKTHIRYTHDTERRHSCETCGKQFVSSSDLQRHQKIVHDKVRDFLCQKCGKSFQTSTNAKRHFLEVCNSTHKSCNNFNAEASLSSTTATHKQ